MKGSMVTLTDAELALLDGKCSDKVQREVDAAKARLRAVDNMPHLAAADAAFVADVVEEAKRQGRLIYARKSIRYCNVCGTRPEPVRYKSGRREGQVKDEGIMAGVELADRFVRIKNHAQLGCCDACFKRLKGELADALSGIRAEVPESITGHPPQWKRYKRIRCTECGWEGPECEMGKMPAVMGGYYHGKCPRCPAKSLPLGPRVFDVLDGFHVSPAEEAEAS